MAKKKNNYITIEEVAERWNEKNPIGTPVKRYLFTNPRSDEAGNTKTRSKAWVMGGHSVVVLVDGVSGAVDIDCLQPLESEEGGQS